MTTPVLPEDRWIGIWAPESMRRTADGYGVVAAQSGDTAALNDYADVDVSVLPFLAYQEHAYGFFIGGVESQRREALRLARELNRLVGTEAALDELMDLNFTVGMIRYLDQTTEGTPYLRHKFVDIDIVQPPGQPLGAELVEYLGRVVRETLPYTLELRRVNVIGTLEIIERDYVAVLARAHAWIVSGGEIWP